MKQLKETTTWAVLALIPLLLFGVGGCTAKKRVTIVSRPTSKPAPRTRLVVRDRLLLLTHRGVELCWVRDMSCNLMVKGSIAQAAYESSTGLLWFIEGKLLKAVSLGSSQRRPVTVARGFFTTWFAISRHGKTTARSVGIEGEAKGAHRLRSDCTVHLQISRAAGKFVVLDSCNQDGTPPDQQETEVEVTRYKLKGVTLMPGALAALSSGSLSPARGWGVPTRQPLSKNRTPAPPKWLLHSCDDDELCQQSAPFGAGGVLLVIIHSICGDGCYIKCALYEPKTNRRAAISAVPKWKPPKESGNERDVCGLFHFNTQRDAYFYRKQENTFRPDVTRICVMGKGCTKTTARPMAWTGGGVIVGNKP